jgi:thioredoxin 1
MKPGQRCGVNRNEAMFIALNIINVVVSSAFTPSLHIQAALSRSQQSSTLFNEKNSEKLVIELLTDQNRDSFLHPDDDPSKPILVDAFAPWCGPCKLLDKVLTKAQPRYYGKVNFYRWNVNDKENTKEMKSHFIEMGYTLTKLPSLIVYREGEPIAVRPGFANEFQLDDWLERTLPDVLERTFDENGLKIEPGLMTLSPSFDNVEKSKQLEAGVNGRITNKSAAKDTMNFSKVDIRMFSPMDFKSVVMKERLRIASRYTPIVNDLHGRDEDPGLDQDDDEEVDTICTDETKCWELVEETLGWENRTVAPATAGLPTRVLA